MPSFWTTPHAFPMSAATAHRALLSLAATIDPCQSRILMILW
jgi:hypothetical protein